MKKIISTLAVAAIASTMMPYESAAAGNVNLQEILNKLEYLQNKVMSQEEHIEAQAQMIKELQTHLSKDVAAEQDASTSEAPKVKLANKFIDNLTLKGDLRVRYERRDHEEPNGLDEGRDRWRTRLRVGGIWKNKTENWEVGAGVATGDSSATSTNDTWSDNNDFETGDFRLDYAYGKHKWNPFTFTLGQQKNPFENSWILWDSDIRPAGLTAHYGEKNGPFATVGAYGVRYVQESTNAWNTAMLYYLQGGYRGEIDKIKYLISLGYHDYDSVFETNELPGNSNYEINVGDLYGKVSVPIKGVNIGMYGQIWQNFGADGMAGQGQRGGTLIPEDEDMGWTLGADAKINKLKLKYAYAQVGADSLYGNLKDQDFGDGLSDTDVKGHKFGFAYEVTKNWSAEVTAHLYEALERTGEEDVGLYQFDVKYKF